MKVLVKNACILDPSSSFHKKTMDVAVVGGLISAISQKIEIFDFDEVIEGENIYISTGWVDGGVHYKDPGEEWLENLESLQEAALAGGITTVIGFPIHIQRFKTKSLFRILRIFLSITSFSFLI
jgi:dihydroorotase